MAYLLGHRDKKELRQVKEGRSEEARELPHKIQLRAFPRPEALGAARERSTEHNVLLVHIPPFCFSSTLDPTHAKV